MASVSAPAWACPLTKNPLERVTRSEAGERLGGELRSLPRQGSTATPVGSTDVVLLDPVGQRAYPLVDDVPILLAPERLEVGSDTTVDLTHPHYAEAYAEMEFYNSTDVHDAGMARVLSAITARPDARGTFPAPAGVWIDSVYDGPAQLDCYEALAPIGGKAVMQLGGAGLHAVKFLLGGAATAVLITPMISEARRAVWLAEQSGVADRLHVALGVAEELPLADESLHGIYSGGCVHHMQVEAAMREVLRVLREGGIFTASEPWRAPLYTLGTKVLGKREANAHCTPLTAASIAPFFTVFEDAAVTHHGTFTRYPFLALSKAGHRTTPTKLLKVFEADDRIADRLGMRKHGSSVSMVSRRGRSGSTS